MIRKLLLTGIIVFIDPGSTAQIFVACNISFFFIAMHMACQPYMQPGNNYLKTAAEIQTFVTLLISIVLRSELEGETITKGTCGNYCASSQRRGARSSFNSCRPKLSILLSLIHSARPLRVCPWQIYFWLWSTFRSHPFHSSSCFRSAAARMLRLWLHLATGASFGLPSPAPARPTSRTGALF